MKQLAGYVSDYFSSLDKFQFFITSLIISALIYINYTFHLNSRIITQSHFLGRLTGFYGLYLPVFAGLSWLINRRLHWLLLVAPLLFAAKVAFRTDDILLQWPLKALIVLVPVLLIAPSATGFRRSPVMPYLWLLALMCPLVIMAAFTEDFQQVYPKLYMLGDKAGDWLNIVLFELSYGIDFFTIELFFRGFCVLSFIKYAGRNAILPMAAFYCCIHFGKPLMECISSFFGGLILGAIVYNTRSIWGGLIVHLGIAWLMELMGWIAEKITTNS